MYMYKRTAIQRCLCATTDCVNPDPPQMGVDWARAASSRVRNVKAHDHPLHIYDKYILQHK